MCCIKRYTISRILAPIEPCSISRKSTKMFYDNILQHYPVLKYNALCVNKNVYFDYLDMACHVSNYISAWNTWNGWKICICCDFVISCRPNIYLDFVARNHPWNCCKPCLSHVWPLRTVHGTVANPVWATYGLSRTIHGTGTNPVWATYGFSRTIHGTGANLGEPRMAF